MVRSILAQATEFHGLEKQLITYHQIKKDGSVIPVERNQLETVKNSIMQNNYNNRLVESYRN